MKKIIYSDTWGEIQEITRWRDTRPGKHGRFVKDASANRFKKYKPVKEIAQYRTDFITGKRSDPIIVQRPGLLQKASLPRAFDRYNGSIYEMVRETNLFTQVHKANTAFVNIRGYDAGRNYRRFQFYMDFGKQNEDEQLAEAIASHLEDQDIEANRYRSGHPVVKGLSDIELSVTLRK